MTTDSSITRIGANVVKVATDHGIKSDLDYMRAFYAYTAAYYLSLATRYFDDPDQAKDINSQYYLYLGKLARSLEDQKTYDDLEIWLSIALKVLNTPND